MAIRAGGWIVALATAGLVNPVPAQVDSTPATFLRWAAGALRPVSVDTSKGRKPDLAPLLEMIGPARLVGFSEATHSGAVVLRFRNAIFLALARQRGFRALAIESGQSEGERLYRYVRGNSTSLDAAVDSGFTWTFNTYRPNRELLQSLRAYNVAAPPDRTVSLYGFDVPGSPGNTSAVRGVGTALEEALAYLARVDPEAEAELRTRAGSFKGLDPPAALARHRALDQRGRDRLTGAVADLLGVMERRWTAYAAASSAEQFEWGHRHAIGAREIDTWLRIGLPTGAPHLVARHSYRDWAMADNIEWIRQREGGDSSGLMVFASRFHIAGAPVLISQWADSAGPSITLGTHLRSRLGSRVVLIGNVYGRARACRSDKSSLGLDRVLESLGVHAFALDLRKAPPAARAWLDRTQAMGEFFTTSVGQAFDILFYNQIEAPSCTDSPSGAR
jgi:erythromycin esterase